MSEEQLNQEVIDTAEEATSENVDVPIEEKYQALEEQCYLMYVQLHALTKLLIDKSVIEQDDLINSMNDLDKDLVSVIKSIVEEEQTATSN